MQKFIRPLGILSAFLIGGLVPQLHVLSPLIPWFIRFMIFMNFLQCRKDQIRLRWSHFFLLLLNVLIAVVSCEALCALGLNQLGLAAFFSGLAPTGTAAPTVMGFLGGNIEYVFTAFLLSTFFISMVVPALIPWALQSNTPGIMVHISLRVLSVIILPVLAAFIVRMIVPKSTEWPKKCKSFIFVSWLFVVCIICAGASNYIQSTPNLSRIVLFQIAAITMFICFLNFFLGYCFGEKEFRRECSQSLGQKNTSITIFLAYLYADPLVALGPTFYVLWHNSWNAWQLRKQRSEPDIPIDQSKK